LPTALPRYLFDNPAARLLRSGCPVLMSSVSDHYQRLLAPIYLWMAGGSQYAIGLGAADLATLGITRSSGAAAVDLGAGFGMHAIPLAQLGYQVTAVDSSAVLLRELGRLSEGVSVRAVEDDLLNFEASLVGPPALIVCMGDTLTHLENIAQVESLCKSIAHALAPGGRLVTTFRDYTRAAQGDARFIPVRSDADRIHTCFLEEAGDHMLVYDIVHERREGGKWSQQVSHYAKLRLDPGFVAHVLSTMGLEVAQALGPRGMVQISATKPK
jgi:SAM-dependent methyltransferase